jgi:hypothetical protein
MFYLDLFRALHRARTRYLLVGGRIEQIADETIVRSWIEEKGVAQLRMRRRSISCSKVLFRSMRRMSAASP